MSTPDPYYGHNSTGHSGGQYPSYDDEYPTQSYAEYQESLKQNQVFASRQPAKEEKKRRSGKFTWAAIIAAVLVVAGSAGVFYASNDDAGSNPGINVFSPTSSDKEEALEFAQKQVDNFAYSQARLEERLADDYEPRFTDNAIEYAMDNVDADWNAEALEDAESYLEHSHYSLFGLERQLSSPHGGGFTEEQTQYALDNVEVDWNEEAAEAAESYWELPNVNTPEKLRDSLVSENVAGFTEEQADYGMREIGVS